jgi:hypothetical protein
MDELRECNTLCQKHRQSMRGKGELGSGCNDCVKSGADSLGDTGAIFLAWELLFLSPFLTLELANNF